MKENFLLKEQINYKNKSEVNSTFKLHIDAFRSVDDIEKLNSSVYKRKHHQRTVKVCLNLIDSLRIFPP
jgi:hypothetical protein